MRMLCGRSRLGCRDVSDFRLGASSWEKGVPRPRAHLSYYLEDGFRSVFNGEFARSAIAVSWRAVRQRETNSDLQFEALSSGRCARATPAFDDCLRAAVVLATTISLALPKRYTATVSILIEPPAGNDPR